MFNPEYQLGLDTELLTSKDTIRFFDIDGVLAIYGYGTDGINVCPDDKFDTFIESFELYKYAVAPDFMREYIDCYTVPGNTYVLSQSGSPVQDAQKIAFVNRCYPGAFPEDHILFSRTSDKSEIVQQVLAQLPDGLKTPHVMIDDSAGVLSKLQDAGINAVHVSSLMLFAELKKDTPKAAEDAPKKETSEKITLGKRTGARIKEIRLARGLTRAQLGAFVGLDQNRVQQYENGRRNPKMDLLVKFATALRVSPAALIDPDTMSPTGAVRALFDIERLYGATLGLIESENGKAISIKIDPTNRLYRDMRQWYEKQEKKSERLRSAKTEKTRKEILEEYQDWEWKYC